MSVLCFIERFATAWQARSTTITSLDGFLTAMAEDPDFEAFATRLNETDWYDAEVSRAAEQLDATEILFVLRQLTGGARQPLQRFLFLTGELLTNFNEDFGERWLAWAEAAARDERGSQPLYQWVESLRYDPLEGDDHARFPTSGFRRSSGTVVSNEDDRVIDAVSTLQVSSSVQVSDKTLSLSNPTLARVYGPAGRCLAVVDRNVEKFYGPQLDAYFRHHRILLEKRVVRAMEVDKDIGNVEALLAEFKQFGVARHEPVLVVGGGVLADVAGLACALYHRGTPYVMLSTSIVSGIDAGPSPRTCCDGFGYKNLFGAYHPPALSLMDRSFFSTLRPGWLRHGIAEIVKMAVVKDATLFADLEAAGPALVATRFGTRTVDAGSRIDGLSQAILGAALRSYVEAEYGNLFETHQCRPHAYGHTWSPGFELSAGLLHGHAVSIGMGFGAYLSHQRGWLPRADLMRILNLISRLDLSLWNDAVDEPELWWQAQNKIIQKRGGHLAAPVPRGRVGACGYIEELSRDELIQTLTDYRDLCHTFPRAGVGLEPFCVDVGLEDPASTVPTQQSPTEPSHADRQGVIS